MAPPRSPFPGRISPFAAQAEHEVRRYLSRFELFRSWRTARYYRSSRLGYLVSRIYPHALPERLMVIADWYGVWTMFDDQLEKLPDVHSAAAVAVVAEAMLSWLTADGSPVPADPPFAPAFADVWRRMTVHSSPCWQRRFLRHTREYLDGCRWEAEHRHAGIVPALDSYQTLRRRFGGIRMAMDLAEFSRGYALTPEVHAHPLVQDLLDVLGDITLWGNDLYSVAVDSEEGNVSNLVFVLQATHSCTPAEAAAIAAAMLRDRAADLARVEAAIAQWCVSAGLPPADRRDIGYFVEGVHTWISGNIDWSRDNARYRTARPRVGGRQPLFLLSLLR